MAVNNNMRKVTHKLLLNNNLKMKGSFIFTSFLESNDCDLLNQTNMGSIKYIDDIME